MSVHRDIEVETELEQNQKVQNPLFHTCGFIDPTKNAISIKFTHSFFNSDLNSIFCLFIIAIYRHQYSNCNFYLVISNDV